MTRPRDWTPAMVCVALCAAVVAAGAVWLLWTAEPVLTLLAGIWAASTGLCVLASTRNLRARLEATQQVVDAWNSSEARDELSKSPPAGTKAVMYDQDAGGDYHHREALAFLGFGPPPGRPRMGADLAYPMRDQVGANDPVPMTVAETDRLIANLQALPDATLTVNGTFDAGPDINGQVCAVCGKPAGGALTERTLDGDGWGELVTFLCDDHYAAAMAEEGDRG